MTHVQRHTAVTATSPANAGLVALNLPTPQNHRRLPHPPVWQRQRHLYKHHPPVRAEAMAPHMPLGSQKQAKQFVHGLAHEMSMLLSGIGHSARDPEGSWL